jgi:3-oxoacyl-(acyl-carrier-protein) synthase
MSATQRRRVVVTGMGINTPIGDSLDTFYQNLIAGKSAITRWRFFENSRVYSKVGGDLSGYDKKAKLQSLRTRLPEEVFGRLNKNLKKAPFSTSLALLTSADAWLNAGLPFDLEPTRQAVIVGGHNINENYLLKNHDTFLEEPDYVDSLAPLLLLDTDHAASIGEMLGSQGALYTTGGACASTNIALRCAIDEIRHHEHDIVVLSGPPLDFSPMGLHAMALMGAITFQSFNDDPARASRPFDVKREGFVPSHGTGTLILEELEHAKARGARIYAEVLSCVAVSDGCHLPTPSQEGQARVMSRLLKVSGVHASQVDFISAHATSTPLGDVSEIGAIKQVFGEHAYRLKLNAPKSMLGHTCWAAPVVETVAALLQMQGGQLHPSINVEQRDPAIDLDVCANVAVKHNVEIMMKNSFGFGGITCCALWKRYSDA